MLTVLPLTNAGTRLMNDGCPPESIKWTNVLTLSHVSLLVQGSITILQATISEAVPSDFRRSHTLALSED